MDKVIITKLILLLFTFYANGHVTISPNLKISNLERIIDISSQVVRITNKMELENTGREPISNFVFAVEPKYLDKLAVIKARFTDSDISLRIDEITVDNKKSWLINFENPIEEKKVKVDVYLSLIDYLVPYPTQITQRQRQYIKFNGNVNLYSPYPTKKSVTSISVGTKNIESYTRNEHVSLSDSHILYKGYENVAPYTISEVEIHYENNSPFLIASKLERQIEVSHWGNIAIEEEITLEHTGAKLKGPFSRYDYQREPDSGISSVKSFKTILPGTAQDIYYRDEIGNISTSHLYGSEHSVEVELRPRFPLFGGWNTRYILGYNVPSYTYLFTKGDNFLLKVPLIDHIFDNMVIKEAVIKIILPEGSNNIDVTLPYPAERLADSLHHTYLDTIGRPVITIRKTNLVEDHIESFEIRYVFPKMFMLLEPLLIVGFLFILFVTVIIYVRLDFSLSKDEVAEQKLRVSGLSSKFIGYQERIMKLLQYFDDKFNTAKYSPDLNAFNTAVKSFNNDFKTITTQISEISSKLKTEAPTNVEKIDEIQKVTKQLKELYHQQQTLFIEKLIPRKINKTGFLDAENIFIKKRDELVGKINKLVKSLD